mmetsp:Transcript_8865/g.17318  ORF Transcript_8865/g.17318 Transcript_8865/m.17318 type:complete len:136 (+) Transcript_8865:1144-1551(+)
MKRQSKKKKHRRRKIDGVIEEVTIRKIPELNYANRPRLALPLCSLLRSLSFSFSFSMFLCAGARKEASSEETRTFLDGESERHTSLAVSLTGHSFRLNDRVERNASRVQKRMTWPFFFFLFSLQHFSGGEICDAK